MGLQGDEEEDSGWDTIISGIGGFFGGIFEAGAGAFVFLQVEIPVAAQATGGWTVGDGFFRLTRGFQNIVRGFKGEEALPTSFSSSVGKIVGGEIGGEKGAQIGEKTGDIVDLTQSIASGRVTDEGAKKLAEIIPKFVKTWQGVDTANAINTTQNEIRSIYDQPKEIDKIKNPQNNTEKIIKNAQTVSNQSHSNKRQDLGKEEKAKNQTKASKFKEYKVEYGDDLWKLWKKNQSGTTWDEMKEANKHLKNIDKIWPGNKVFIPKDDDKSGEHNE